MLNVRKCSFLTDVLLLKITQVLYCCDHSIFSFYASYKYSIVISKPW